MNYFPGALTDKQAAELADLRARGYTHLPTIYYRGYRFEDYIGGQFAHAIEITRIVHLFVTMTVYDNYISIWMIVWTVLHRAANVEGIPLMVQLEALATVYHRKVEKKQRMESLDYSKLNEKQQACIAIIATDADDWTWCRRVDHRSAQALRRKGWLRQRGHVGDTWHIAQYRLTDAGLAAYEAAQVES